MLATHTNRHHQSAPWALLRDESGAALAVAIMMLLGLAAMGAAAVMLSSTELVVAGNERQHRAALDVAEAGIAEGMHRLGLRPGSNVTVNGSTFDASIRDTNTPPDPNWTARIFLSSNTSVPASNDPLVQHSGTIQSSSDFMEYSHATDTDLALTITHKTRDFDGDGTAEVVYYNPAGIPPENPWVGFPVERLTVTGREGTAARSVVVDAIRFPINPNVNAALLSDGEVDVRGTVAICGRNHRANVPAHTGLPGCSPAFDDVDGHLVGVRTTGDQVLTNGTVDLLGDPTATNTDAGNSFMSLAEALGVSQDELDNILAGADRTSVAGGGPWDGITYITGDLTIPDGAGAGLLYVTGDLELRGNFEWWGLVYVEGDLTNNGNTWILGAAIVRGSAGGGVDLSAGTPDVLYSRDVLSWALTMAMKYTVLNWKEV